MKSIIKALSTAILICLVCFISEAAAQDIIEKKLSNGEDISKYVWVILAEGYTESELEKFQNDTSLMIDGFFSVSPFKEYKSAINIYTVFIASDESGADHPSSGIYVDTPLDATFDSYGTARLLTVNAEKAFKAASQIPQYDVVFALVNDDQYGGSGGSVIAVSTNQASIETALHEAGHVIGRLADEYETEYQYPEGDYEPNVTYQYKRGLIPWKTWISPDVPVPTPDDFSPDSVGLFEGARYLSEDIYRPKLGCRMRSLSNPFCEICREALILKIYEIVDPVEKFSPAQAETELTPGSAVIFRAETSNFDETLFESFWEIDEGILENEFQTTFTLDPSTVKQGKHTVSIWIRDTTEMVRTDTRELLTSNHTWNINKGFCSGKLSVAVADRKTGHSITEAAITVSGLGEILKINEHEKYEIADITCGTYFLSINADSFKSTEKEIAVTDGEVSTLDVLLEPGEENYYIKGSITGELKGDVFVELSGDTSSSTKTDTDGSFIFGPVEAGSYTVTPKEYGFRFVPRSQKIEVGDKDISGLTFAAQQTGVLFIIAGIIQGDIKEGIIVSASGEKEVKAVTDSQGKFKLENLPAGQYVLKPSFTGAAFEPAQVKVEIAEEDVKELKFLSKKTACPASQIAPRGSTYVSTLRLLRDNVLRKNRKGQFYISLYYLASPEVDKILRKNKPLRQEALTTLNRCMPEIKLLLNGDSYGLSDTSKIQIINFAGHLSAHGSPLLKKIIEHFLKDFEEGNILK